MEIRAFEPRLYQQTILSTASKKNTLVVLPTGLGKTNIAVMLAANRLTNYPKSKVLILAPTRPLCEQHYESIKENLLIDQELVSLFTGTLSPALRAEKWDGAQIVVSTPQGLENDVISGKLNLKDVSLVVFDEAHRAVGDYSYVFIAKSYLRHAHHPRILALTASPGSESEKIKEVCRNLSIEEIEVRGAQDPDVAPYVKEIDIDWVRVDLPEEFIQVRKWLQASFNSKLEEIKRLGLLSSSISPQSKTALLDMQRALYAQVSSGEKSYEMMKSLSLLAEALKVSHALELVETQDLQPLLEYFNKLEEEAERTTVKAVRNLVRDLNFRTAAVQARKLHSEGTRHPKIEALKNLVTEELSNKHDTKIIIFNQYRDSSSLIKQVMDSLGVESRVFVGQAKKKDTGLSQKEQKKILQDFREGAFNCLIATSVAEEGLDIPQVDLVVFYEPVPSAIRSVQRRGRTGRNEKGRVVVLITRATRDEANQYSSINKEKRMYRAIGDIKKGFVQETSPVQKRLETEEGTTVVADHRERSNPVIKELADRGVKIDLQRLEVADYLLSERVAVEYKTQRDFVDSIIDGRLLAQLPNLAKYSRPIVVVEGDQDIYSQRNIHPNAIRGMLATIAVSWAIPIIQTKNFKDTAELFLSISKREAAIGKKDASLHAAKPLTDKQVQEYIVSSFPGVGPAIAKPILSQFKSIKGFVNASEKELQEVELIGQKKAKRIKEIVEREYDSPDS